MTDLIRRAMAMVPLTAEAVESMYRRGVKGGDPNGVIASLCESHERLRRELGGAEMVLAQTQAERDALRDRLAAIEAADTLRLFRRMVEWVYGEREGTWGIDREEIAAVDTALAALIGEEPK